MPLKFANNQSLTGTTALPSAVPTDNLILISTQTASNSANISFTSGLNGTYDEYQFKFINIHPATDNAELQFNFSTDGGNNYNVTKTTTFFLAQHAEDDSYSSLEYGASRDLAQSTSYQNISVGVGSDADQNVNGSLTLFNPSSTTYVKHFLSVTNSSQGSDYCTTSYSAGYGNTTSAINAIRFVMTSGNIDDGVIKLYGVKKS